MSATLNNRVAVKRRRILVSPFGKGGEERVRGRYFKDAFIQYNGFA